MDEDVLNFYKEVGATEQEIADAAASGLSREEHLDILEGYANDMEAAKAEAAPTAEPVMTDEASMTEPPQEEVNGFLNSLADSSLLPGFPGAQNITPRNIAGVATNAYRAMRDDPVGAVKEIGAIALDTAGSTIGGVGGLVTGGVVGGPVGATVGAGLGSAGGGIAGRELAEYLGLREDTGVLEGDKTKSILMDAGFGAAGALVGKAVSVTGKKTDDMAKKYALFADPSEPLAEIIKAPTRKGSTSPEMFQKFREQVDTVIKEIPVNLPREEANRAFEGMAKATGDALKEKIIPTLNTTKEATIEAVKAYHGGVMPKYSFQEVYGAVRDQLSNQKLTAQGYEGFETVFKKELDTAVKRTLDKTEQTQLERALSFFKRKDIHSKTGSVDLFTGGRESVEKINYATTKEVIEKGIRGTEVRLDKKAKALYEEAEKHWEVIRNARQSVLDSKTIPFDDLMARRDGYSGQAKLYAKVGGDAADTKPALAMLFKNTDEIIENQLSKVPEQAKKYEDTKLLYGAYKDVKKQLEKAYTKELTARGKESAKLITGDKSDSGFNLTFALRGGISPYGNMSKRVEKTAALTAREELQGALPELLKFAKTPPSNASLRLRQWAGVLGSEAVKADPFSTTTGKFFSAEVGQLLEETFKFGYEMSQGNLRTEVNEDLSEATAITERLQTVYLEGQNATPERQREMLAELAADPEIVAAGVFERPEHELTTGIYSVVDGKVMDPKEREVVRKRIDQLDIPVAAKAKASRLLNRDGTLMDLPKTKPVRETKLKESQQKVELSTLVSNINSSKAKSQDKDILESRRTTNILPFKRTGSE